MRPKTKEFFDPHGFEAEEKRMIRKAAGLFLAGLAVLATAHGQAVKPIDKTIVLKAARLFDGKSGALVKPGVVVVRDGKIVAAGTNAALPTGAEGIDLGDAPLLPGFIDAHTHLTGMYREDYTKARLAGPQKPIPGKALDSSVDAPIPPPAGVPTARDAGSH